VLQIDIQGDYLVIVACQPRKKMAKADGFFFKQFKQCMASEMLHFRVEIVLYISRAFPHFIFATLTRLIKVL
jgi:hypothetical protein